MTGLGRVLIVLAAATMAACSPSLSVSNGTSFEVRAIVSGEGGTRNVHLVRPGQASGGDIPEGGYSVTIVPDQAWVAAGRAARDALAAQLARPDQLGPEEIAEVVRQLEAVHARLAEFEAEAAADAQCSGTVAPDGVAVAEVAIEADGRLVVRCSGDPA